MSSAVDEFTPGPAVRTDSLVPAVQIEIERQIAAGELAGGDRINESALATRLTMSRGPIREACRMLEQIGLLRSEINRGFFVRQLSTKEALDLYDVRASLFGLAGRLCAGTVSAEQLADLDDLVDRMETAARTSCLSDFYPANVRFHRRIVDFADNYKLSMMMPSLEAELHLFRTRALVQPGAMLVSNGEHRSIVEALRAGDATGAGRLLERHIMAGKSRLLKALEDSPDDSASAKVADRAKAGGRKSHRGHAVFAKTSGDRG
jgi:DNA-binding GntR family transcriptional regulator